MRVLLTAVPGLAAPMQVAPFAGVYTDVGTPWRAFEAGREPRIELPERTR